MVSVTPSLAQIQEYHFSGNFEGDTSLNFFICVRV